MRSGGVLHVWFPTYDPALAKYSPGLVLWLELARAAADLGLWQFDLGKGQERYKTSLQSAAGAWRGSVDRRLVAGSLRRGWLAPANWFAPFAAARTGAGGHARCARLVSTSP